MVDGRLTWSGYQLPAVRAARPAKVFGRARLIGNMIGKIYYRRCTSVPAILQRLARSTSDLRRDMATVRVHVPIQSARSCKDARSVQRYMRDSAQWPQSCGILFFYCTP